MVDDLVAQGAPAFEAATPMLSQLLKAEIAEREVRSIAYHTKVARFPSYKDLTGLDFASSDINEATGRHWQKPCRHSYRRSGDRASQTQSALLLNRRTRQRIGTRKDPRKGRELG